jgi:DNA-binding XRE family transcriptional regulator
MAGSKKYLSGKQVRAFRVSRGYTQKELGELLGMSMQSVEKYEVRGVPKSIALALSAIDAGLVPFTPGVRDFKKAKKGVANNRKTPATNEVTDESSEREDVST